MGKRKSSNHNPPPKRSRKDSDDSSSDPYTSSEEDDEDEMTESTFFTHIQAQLGRKLTREDKAFVQYFLKGGKYGLTSDTKYFANLKKKEKVLLLKTLGEISKINLSHKPHMFRALQSNMPLDVKAEFVHKLTVGSSSDSSKMFNWLDSLLKIPFGTYAEDDFHTDKAYQIEKARHYLETAVYGHQKAKQKLLHVVAQHLNNPSSKGMVLGLRGCHGIGKTVLCRDGISKIFNRPFAQISLGGATGSSFFEGFSYTYEGSTYGRIADILMKSKVMNPVIYFDELDKVSRTDRGEEINNVLMHLTDPSQNKTFHDKYFSGIDLDLSRAIFVFSYNNDEYINPILLDRITQVNVSGFKLNDKVNITRNFLLSDVTKEVGFNKRDIHFTPTIIKYIIENYTDEGGVRKLKELLFHIVREINLRILSNEDIKLPFRLTEDLISKDILKDFRKKRFEKIMDEPMVGRIEGMYACNNETGGILPIEVKAIPTRDKLELELTGLPGDVMQQSMKVARTVAWEKLSPQSRNDIELYWINYGNTGYHIHVPDGSTPKDGPSAGLAITSALISKMTNRRIRNDVAVTGEIDLHGNALAIGGLVHKLYGAKRAGVKLALCPLENKKDLDKIKEEHPSLIQEGKFDVETVENIDDVLRYVMVSEI